MHKMMLSDDSKEILRMSSGKVLALYVWLITTGNSKTFYLSPSNLHQSNSQNTKRFSFGSLTGKESLCSAGDPSSMLGLGRFPGEGIDSPFQYSWASLVAQMVTNMPAVRETWVQSLSWEDPLEKGTAIHSSILARRIPWTEEPGSQQSMGSQSQTQLSNFHSQGGASGKEPVCQCRRCKRHGFDLWVRKIPWRRAWQPTQNFKMSLMNLVPHGKMCCFS